MPPPDRFEYRAARSVQRERLAAFAEAVWGSGAGATIGQRWWMASELATATCAVERASGEVAALCVGVPSQWRIAGKAEKCTSICGWFVAPGFQGLGLGKQLVERFAADRPLLNALSISDAAIRNFAKLGWTGPFKTQLLLLPTPGLRRSRGSPQAFVVEQHRVGEAGLPLRLSDALDRIEAAKPGGRLRADRGAAAWRAHLSGRPGRELRFITLSRDGEPLGYAATRPADEVAGKAYRAARLHFVVDLVADRPEANDALLGALASSASTAGALLWCTTDERLAQAATRNGWLDSHTPIVGKLLARKAPLAMQGGGFNRAGAPIGQLELSFFDSDVDFNI